MDKILLLGHTGKMGLAIEEVFKDDYLIIGKNSKDFNACDFDSVKKIIEENKPDIVINTVAKLGIDPCELEPDLAFKINTLYPKFLAELSNKFNFLLIHFSTDAVFRDKKSGYYTEKDSPFPLNVYGFTKFGGDCFVLNYAKRFYIFRVSLLFGPSIKKNQFVEKMLEKIKTQKVLKVSSDIIISPTYSIDVAREIKRIIKNRYKYGLYHIANKGKASLYDVIKEIVKNLNIDIEVKKASYKDFEYIGIKNTYTPIKSKKLKPLRDWRLAIKDYCKRIKWAINI